MSTRSAVCFPARVMKPRVKRAPRVTVVLAGCGCFDGSEAHETVATLLSLDRAGAEVIFAAPNVVAPVIVNHSAGHPMIGECRNVLVESARLARGEVRDLAKVCDLDVDAVLVPGGYGATQVLCDHARAGREARALPEVVRLLEGCVRAGRPMGFACMAPVVAARVLGARGVTVGLGAGTGAAADMEAWGATVRTLGPRDVSVDRELRVVCCAAYTTARRVGEMFEGVDRMVRATLEFAGF